MPDLRHAVDAYLRSCFSREDTPRVAELAVMLRIPRERLSRDFASSYGVPLSSYLKRRQIRQAQRLLASSELSTTRIGYLCGFGTRRTFYRAFRRGTGLSPDQYRRMHAHEMSLAASIITAQS
ncbi:MAG TPA: helix-turn-helix transcriptional regulator [Thermoanaerobaculia bacterium]|nr:helix-turn-helix transcriptional regulator [Thermoanaerobaculia bacterium]